MAALWPFSMWGIDVIGPINPKASNRHLFILVAINYFTKWIEAIMLVSVTANAVARFLKRDIIARYGNLNNRIIDDLCERFKIHHHNSTPYGPQMNGAVEVANKNIKRIIEKMTVTYKDWHEMLPFALLAYRTSIRTSTGATPYSLVLHIAPDSRGKFAYQYDGPFVVKEVFSGEAIILSDMDGIENTLPVNADALKRYYR
ncbi:hypothetical protein CRG98_021503 [Punica granatum]|uniref:Integrase catalytic domain-containing protein n=1 Tax=Punica granatum TaxID=22663 RepID=A0A2I0JP98_PUNGR|nr:hypothetical protein CRG98_021503 [Punica granatum]